ncbi:Methyltransferase-like protein 4 [Larimichthys crocea]|uniref:Uncharacterized protein n=1 Tax=Larimichthys crocea TaxID=215358 RepID=A0ACD3QPC5_LARCR|nr:Methyltransferase-like protein 4 [Larimichthys crocea]
MGEQYVIPPCTAFLLSDFTRMQPLVHSGSKFDLIVMDPPWENKSVKRSRRYSFLPSTQLKRLPVPLLASPNCLVVTWVTNRPSHLRFVRDELYPHWGVEVVAEWFWVKTCFQPFSSSVTSEVPVEDQRLIVSVPSALHSQKPSLSEVLKPYVGGEAKCLELFARCLQPGWTSWGNEVLKFQHTSYFTLTPADEREDVSKGEATRVCTDKPTITPVLSSPGESPPPRRCPTTCGLMTGLLHVSHQHFSVFLIKIQLQNISIAAPFDLYFSCTWDV